MARLINEVYDIKFTNYRKKDGTTTGMVYIDPKTSENTYPLKDEIKGKYGAMWNNAMKSWCWYVGNDPATRERIVDTKVKPCLEFLINHEQAPASGKRDVIAEIDKLLSVMNSGDVQETQSPTILSLNEVKAKIESYKQDLMNAMTDEEFQRALEPIIKFRQAQGHQFSFLNALLIMVQDPKAKMVKSRGRWAKMNREVKPDAPAIYMWVPLGDSSKSEDEKKAIKAKFLRKCGASSVRNLTPGQKEELDIQLKAIPDAKAFKLAPFFYDIRFTTTMEGKEDLVGDGNVDLPWFSEGEETEDSVMYFDAMLKVVEKSGVKLNYVDDLGGARGVSKSGKIDLLNGGKKDIGALDTLVHEFAHEMLHQKYLKSNNSELSGYFVGTTQGRAKVEQQAEICAWIVLKTFGYNMQTNINYVGIWGMNAENCVETFNSVSNVATYIVNEINNNLNNGMNEAIGSGKVPSGEELADMFGYGDMYRYGLKQKEKLSSMFESIVRKAKMNLI